MNEATGVSVKVVGAPADKPVTLVFSGNRAMCSCGWMGIPRWFVYGARIDAQIHHLDTGHGVAEPLVGADKGRPIPSGSARR